MKHLYRLLKKIRRMLIQFGFDLVRALSGKNPCFGGPKGVFSVFDHPAAVSLIAEGQTPVPATPGSLRDISGLRQDKFQPWPIFTARFSQARLVGENLVVMNDQKQVMVENLYGTDYYRSDGSYNYYRLPPAVHLKGNWTSVLGRWCHSGRSTFSHWMIDGLPRLAALDRFPSDTGILIPEPLQPTQRESLEILGLTSRCRPTLETHLVVENYHCSSFTAMVGCDNPYAIRFLRDRLLNAVAPAASTADKIYITRRGASRAPLQEEEMIAFLEKEGWMILQAEKYTLRQQINLFRHARAVCSIHGAGLTNLLWCEPGCKVLELSATNYLNGSLESLALCLGMDHRFMVFPADKKFRINVDLPKFKSTILAMT